MIRKGVGARVAWSIESRQVENDLANLLRGHPVERLEFEDGESRRELVLNAYRLAGDIGTRTVQRFFDDATFAEAVSRVLSRRPAEERLDIFLQDSERKGVYRATAKAVSECASKLLSYDGNSVLVATEDARHGVLLDLEESPQGPAILELESW